MNKETLEKIAKVVDELPDIFTANILNSTLLMKYPEIYYNSMRKYIDTFLYKLPGGVITKIKPDGMKVGRVTTEDLKITISKLFENFTSTEFYDELYSIRYNSLSPTDKNVVSKELEAFAEKLSKKTWKKTVAVEKIESAGITSPSSQLGFDFSKLSWGDNATKVCAPSDQDYIRHFKISWIQNPKTCSGISRSLI